MNEARADSLYERLRRAGKLDLVMFELINGVKDHKDMARWLKGEGIQTSVSALYDMQHTHGWGWRHDQARKVAAAEELPANMDEAWQAKLRKLLFTLTFEANTLKEVAVLAKIAGDTEKIAQMERRVQVAEGTLNLKVYEAQECAAAEVDAILGEADKLIALQEARKDAKSRGLSAAEVVETIRQMLYRGAAAPLPAKETEVKAA